MKEKRSGFNWIGFLCGPHYYAGYGNVKKGVILALLSFMPLTALAVCIHCGLRANTELPVKQEPFHWKYTAITVAIIIVTAVILEGVFGLYSRGMS